MSGAISGTSFDSSIFGQSPGDWRVDRIRDRLCGIVGGEWGDDPDAHDEGVELPVIRVADIRGLDLTVQDLTIRRIKESKLTGRIIGKQTILLEKSGGGENNPVGRAVRTSMITFDAVCSNFMAKVDCGDTVAPSFVVYALDALYSSGVNGACIQQTTGIQNLRVLDYLNTKIGFPNKSEQQRIAVYLDASCAAIDAAVAAKRRQLETLDALRTTLIYEAVTHGINRSAATVALNIPSYGHTPKHWKRSKLRYEISIQSGDFASDKIQDDGAHPILGGNGVMGHTDLFNVEGEIVVIGRVGAYCGNAHYVNEKAWVSDNALLVKSLHCARFLCHLFNALNFNAQANNTAQPVITGTKIKNTYVVLPPRQEQEAICSYLDQKLAELDRITTTIESQIAALTAYRKSLIHECVTGQRRITEAAVVRNGSASE